MHPSAIQRTLNDENGVLSHGHSKDKVCAHVLPQTDTVCPPRATPTPSCGALRALHPHPACNPESNTNTKSYLEHPRSTILVEPDLGVPVGMRMGIADIPTDGTTDPRLWRAKDLKEKELGREPDGHPNMTDGIGERKPT